MNKQVFVACFVATASALNLDFVDLAQRMNSSDYVAMPGDEELAQAGCEASLAQIGASHWHTKVKVKEKSHKLDPKLLSARGTGANLYSGKHSPCNQKNGIFETPSSEFHDIPTSVLLAHAKKLRLIREAKARAKKLKAEAKALKIKKAKEAALKLKRAKAAKMRKILAKAKAAANALKQKKLKLRNKNVAQVRSAVCDTLSKLAKKEYSSDYAKHIKAKKSKDKAKIRAAQNAMEQVEMATMKLIHTVAKKKMFD